MNNNDNNDNNDIKSFIKDKLDILDKSKSKYKDYINIKDIKLITDSEDKKIIFKKNGEEVYTGKFSYLGLFDLKFNVHFI